MKFIWLLLASLSIAFCNSCSMPTSYYTSPNSPGYHQQGLGGICEKCGRQFLFSGYQLHHITTITCAYCKHPQNVHDASQRWVNIKPSYEQQQAVQLTNAAITGFANGLNSNNNNVSTIAPSNAAYTPSGCSSDYDCGVGQRCAKAQFSIRGVCMKTVNEYGTPVYNTPDLNSIGVNNKKGCTFDTDCPIGFKCDSTHDTCVKR